MIILHFTPSRGKSTIDGVSEIVFLFDDEADLPDDVADLVLNVRYNIPTNVSLGSLPLGVPLLRKI
jgi:hypothetical protein